MQDSEKELLELIESNEESARFHAGVIDELLECVICGIRDHLKSDDVEYVLETCEDLLKTLSDLSSEVQEMHRMIEESNDIKIMMQEWR